MQLQWITDVFRGLRALEGEARLPDLYYWIKQNRTELPPNWQAAVRACLQAHCKESPQFHGNFDLFRNTGLGWWAIRRIEGPVSGNLPEMDISTLAFNRMTVLEWEHFAAIPEEDRLALLRQKVDQFKKELLKGPDK